MKRPAVSAGLFFCRLASLDRINALADQAPGFIWRRQSDSGSVMTKRREFFERFEGAYQALWWIEAGHVPTIDDGLARLWRLDRYGPTREAFTCKMRFPAPGSGGPAVDMKPDPWCPAHA